MPVRECSNCFTPKEDPSRCGKCKQAWYCSRDCQREHHGLHKVECARIATNGEKPSFLTAYPGVNSTVSYLQYSFGKEPNDGTFTRDRNYHGLPSDVFRRECRQSLRQHLMTAHGMEPLAAQALMDRHFDISVPTAFYTQPSTLQLAESVVVIKGPVPRPIAVATPTKSDAASPVLAHEVTLRFHWHTITGWSERDHLSELTFELRRAGAPPESGTFFRSGDVFHEMYLETSSTIGRTFELTSAALEAIRASVFGTGWGSYEALLLMYACAGVPYDDKDGARFCFDLFDNGVAFHSDWLEQHSRALCGLPGMSDFTEEDVDALVAESIELARERQREGGGGGGGTPGWAMGMKRQEKMLKQRKLAAWRAGRQWREPWLMPGSGAMAGVRVEEHNGFGGRAGMGGLF